MKTRKACRTEVTCTPTWHAVWLNWNGTAKTPEMIGVVEDHLPPVGGRWVVAVAALGIRRDPVGRTVEERLVAPALPLKRHPDRMLLGLGSLVILQQADEAVLPLGRRCVVLVGDLVEHVVEVAESIKDLSGIRLLDGVDLRVLECVDVDGLGHVAAETAHIVVRMERMPLPAAGPDLDGALEEHHGNVDAPSTRSFDPAAQPLEVGRVERRQIELGLAVQRLAGARPGVRVWLDVADRLAEYFGLELKSTKTKARNVLPQVNVEKASVWVRTAGDE